MPQRQKTSAPASDGDARQTSDCDALVVSNGATGSLTALLLHRLGLRTLLLRARPKDEAPSGSAQQSSSLSGAAATTSLPIRTVTLSRRSLRVLRDLQLWPQLEAKATPVWRMEVWDAASGGLSRFHRKADSSEPLAQVIALDVLEKALWQQAESCDIIAPPATISALADDGEQTQVSLQDGATLGARLVVAADGAASPLRQMAGIGVRQWDTDQTAIAAVIRTTLPHDNIALQGFIAESGPLAMLPFSLPEPDTSGNNESGDDHWRSLIWSLPSAKASDLLALSDAQFASRCRQACDSAAGDITQIGPRQAFPIRHRRAESLHCSELRLALAGDSAQNIHPLAGQGLNLAFGDALALCDAIRTAGSRNLQPGDTWTLNRYQRHRLSERLPAEALVEGLLRLFAPADRPPASKPLRWLRGLGMRAATDLPPLHRLLLTAADGWP